MALLGLGGDASPDGEIVPGLLDVHALCEERSRQLGFRRKMALVAADVQSSELL